VVEALVARVNDLGYIVAGYALTAVVLAGYVGLLLARARRSRLRSEAVASRRDQVIRPRPTPTTGP